MFLLLYRSQTVVNKAMPRDQVKVTWSSALSLVGLFAYLANLEVNESVDFSGSVEVALSLHRDLRK